MSDGHSTNEEKSTSETHQAAKRPQSGKTRKGRISVKEVSFQLRKENILLDGGSLTSDNGIGPSTGINIESQNFEDFLDHRFDAFDQRSCPSPVETPRYFSLEAGRLLDDVSPENDNPPALKSSFQRVKSAKPRTGRVHFAEDVLSSRGGDETAANSEPIHDDDTHLFAVREERESLDDKIELIWNNAESQNHLFEAGCDTESQNVEFTDRTEDEFLLELHSSDSENDDENLTPTVVRPISRQAGEFTDNTDYDSSVNSRMPDPRIIDNTQPLVTSEVDMEIDSVQDIERDITNNNATGANHSEDGTVS